MKQTLGILLITAACLVGPAGVAGNYSTEATMSLQKDQGTVSVVVRVSRLLEQDGKLVEQLVTEPRIQTGPGVPASLYTGAQPSDPDYASRENVAVDVSWPYPNESGTAFCAVTIKRGSEVMSKSRLQLKIEGPGRVPLVVAAKDIDPNSVRVVEEKTSTCVLLEFAGKSREEVKKLAIENYGNKVRIQDSQGRLTEGGLSLGTYHETGMTLSCSSRNEAEQAANVLREKTSK